jgi:magnesium transporter
MPKRALATPGKIRVMLCDGGVRCGGEELLGESAPADGALWIDLEGSDPRFEKLLAAWGFHPLAIEDTFTLHHQPKIEEYGETLFLIARGIDFNERRDPVRDDVPTLKLAAFLDDRRLVTLHRAPLRSVEIVRERVEQHGRQLPGGAAQLLWSICDEMMDHYFPVVDQIGEAVEKLEERVVENPEHEHLELLLAMRRQLATLRRTMLPHRQVFQHLANSRAAALGETGGLNFRDTLDNVLRLIDAIDQQRDLLTNVKDTYLSVVAQRTNDVMRILTIFSAILLPLSLIAGIYGMNFEWMPELGERWGYPAALGLMAAVAAGMLLWFRGKRWL